MSSSSSSSSIHLSPKLVLLRASFVFENGRNSPRHVINTVSEMLDVLIHLHSTFPAVTFTLHYFWTALHGTTTKIYEVKRDKNPDLSEILHL